MDISDFTRTHPATYHYAVETARQVTEAVRTGNVTHKADLKAFIDAFGVGVAADLWIGSTSTEATAMNIHSKNMNWLAQEVTAKQLNTSNANNTEIKADVVSITAVASAAL